MEIEKDRAKVGKFGEERERENIPTINRDRGHHRNWFRYFVDFDSDCLGHLEPSHVYVFVMIVVDSLRCRVLFLAKFAITISNLE